MTTISLLCLCAVTQCDAGVGTNALFEQLYRMPPKLLVLGAGCSAVSEATAQVSHLWNLVQVSDVLLKRSLVYFCLTVFLVEICYV